MAQDWFAQFETVKPATPAPRSAAATTLKPADEKRFRSWYGGMAKRHDLNPDPDDPAQLYDYRGAFKANAKPGKDGHWPSQFKMPGHPNEIVGGFNTRTGERVAGTKRATESELVGLGWEPATARSLAAKPEPGGDFFDQFETVGPRMPASPDDFTDRPKAPEGSAAGRFAAGAWEMLNPVSLVTGLAGAARHPIDTARGLVGAQTAQLGKARDAYQQGRYSEMVGHAAAGVLPVVGPMAAGIGEGIAETGDVATGLGRAAGVLVPTGAAVKAGSKAVGAVRGKIPPKALTRPQLAAAAANAKQAEAVRWALDNGIPVDAATATGNRVVRGAKAVADSSLGGAVSGQRAAAARADALTKVGRDLARRADYTPDGIPSVGVTAETAGAGVREGIENVIREQARTADDAYGRVRAAERAALPDDVPVSRPVAGGRTIEQGFIGHWLADDLNEMGYQAGGVTKTMANEARRTGDGFVAGAGRTRGTPTQEMFHAAGITGSRQEIASRIRRVLRGESNDPKVLGVVDAMNEAWDGQRFDFDLITDDTLARTGLKRRDFKSPVTLPAEDAPGASRFFGEGSEGLRASGTEPMQFAVPLQSAKEALRPVFDRLQRKRELTGQLMGDEGRAATALDALLSGPDHASLSVVDAALGDLKAAARGAALPELRTSGQGIAAKAVAELEWLVQTRAKAAGVWDDLRAGRDATIAKWTAAETLDKLRAEPVQTFRMLTSSGDAAVERLREVKRIAPGEVPKIGRAYLDGLIDTATAEGGFGREAKLWAEWDKLGGETKALLYPDRELRTALDRFFLVGKKMAENPNPSGSALVGGLTAQGMLSLMDPVTGAATTIGGAAISKLLNSPKTARLLTQGMQTPRTASAARALAARLRVAIRPSVRTAQASRNAQPESSR